MKGREGRREGRKGRKEGRKHAYVLSKIIDVMHALFVAYR